LEGVSALLEAENVQNVLPVPMLEDFEGVDVDLHAAGFWSICGQESQFLHGVVLAQFDDDEHAVVFTYPVVE
jgi:hypothetical protein